MTSLHISGAWQTFAVCTSFVTLNSSSLAPHCSVAKEPKRVLLEGSSLKMNDAPKQVESVYYERILRFSQNFNLKKNWSFWQKLEISKPEDFWSLLEDWRLIEVVKKITRRKILKTHKTFWKEILKMKSEIWDEKKTQKAKTIVQYLIDNVKNVSVFIRPPIRIEYFPTKSHPSEVTWLITHGFYTFRPLPQARDLIWPYVTSLDPYSDICISVFISVKMYLTKVTSGI